MIQRWRIIWADRLRFSRSLRRLLYAWRLRAKIPRHPKGTQARIETIESLCGLARLASSKREIIKVEERIAGLLPLDPCEAADILSRESDHHLRKVAILKPYDAVSGERGVIFISFEYEWAKLLRATNREEFAKRYHLVVSPTWTPPHSALNCLFPEIWPEPVYCLISNLSDLKTFPRLSQNYRMVNLFASSWVDPDLFEPRPHEERDIDLIMLANFGTYKRHHVLFQAMRDLPEHWKVTLVGQPNGNRTAEVLLAEAEAFGVRHRVDLRQRITDDEVCELLARAKISLICSRREGSCVAVVESMFAGTPVGLLSGAGIGSAAFINDQTGAFLDERNLAEALKQFHARASSMQPRRWCLEERIDARASSDTLNEFLASDSRDRSLSWTRDLLPFHWRPNPLLFEPGKAPWYAEEQKRLETLTGIRFGSQP